MISAFGDRHLWGIALNPQQGEVRGWEVWMLRGLIGGVVSMIVALLGITASRLGSIDNEIKGTRNEIAATNLGLARLEGEIRRVADRQEVGSAEARQNFSELSRRVDRLENKRME